MVKNEYMWTAERLDALDANKLKIVRVNNKGNPEVVAECDRRLAVMNIRTGGNRSSKHDDVRNLEIEGDAHLVQLAKEMNNKYDLSRTTAKERSVGVKKFIARDLLGKSGSSKVGGHQVRGLVAIDRYISYAIGDQKIGLGLILAKEQPVDAHKWFVSCSSSLLPDRKPVQNCIPGMEVVKDNENQGIAFDNFAAASDKFCSLIERIAPHR